MQVLQVAVKSTLVLR